MLRVYHAIATLGILTVVACSTTPTKIDVAPRQPLHVDAFLLQPCKPLSMLTANPTKADTLEQHTSDVTAMAECSVKQARLAEIIRAQIESEK